MKLKFLLIGLALALMLCISPVAAVSGDDFEIVIDKSGDIKTYTYFNKNNPDELYIMLFTHGTEWLNSRVTFKPADISDAPVMEVFTTRTRYIYLPQSVDDWEIKYYSTILPEIPRKEKQLKNKGVVNLKEYFGEYISKKMWLELKLSTGQYIVPWKYSSPVYSIPDVD